MFDGIKRLLFPPKCVFCRELLHETEEYICRSCSQKVWEISRPKNHKGAFYNEALSVYPYEGDVRRAVHRFKFHGGIYLAEFFALKMTAKVENARWKFDIVTAAPSHISKRYKKGYDHAYLLAEGISKLTGAPCCRLLKKTRKTAHMYGLTLAQRRANIMGSVSVCQAADIKNKRILLVDDILTTGSTASECARVLKAAGASYVAVITAAGVK